MSQAEARRVAVTLTEREARLALEAVRLSREQLQVRSLEGGVLARLSHSRALQMVGELQWVERAFRVALGDVVEGRGNGTVS